MSSPAKIDNRVRSLDGLRGVAALAVFFSHAVIVSPSLSRTATGSPGNVAGLALRIFAYSPLRLSWAGPEAVVVFFVLSGYVLTLPVQANAQWNWSAYYGKRLVRLYLPVLGALVFAVTLLLVVHPRAILVGNDPMNGFSTRYGPAELLNDALLLFHPGYWNPVLWSLRWEVIFSLLLPFFIVCGGIGRRRPWVSSLVLVLIMVASRQTDLAFRYMPMFGAGVLLASTRTTWLPRARAFVDTSRWYTRAFIGLICACLLNCTWLVIGTDSPRLIGHAISLNGIVAEQIGITAGAVLLVAISLTFPAVVRLLESRPLQWLGTRSYSFYLTHFPIVLCLAYLFKGWTWIGFFITIAASLLCCEVFYRVVERPSVRLARRAGESARRAVESEPRREEVNELGVPPSRGTDEDDLDQLSRSV